MPPHRNGRAERLAAPGTQQQPPPQQQPPQQQRQMAQAHGGGRGPTASGGGGGGGGGSGSGRGPTGGGRGTGLTPQQLRHDNLLLRRFSVVIWVPSDQVGMVIGKQGAMITHIRNKASVIDVRIMPPDTYGGFEGSVWAPIQIRGSPSATRTAITMVNELVDEIDDVVAEIQLDKTRHHLIIGTKGMVIRKLSADSSVRIHVPNKKENERAVKDNEPPTKVILEGSAENVYQCLSALMDVCFAPPSAKKDAQVVGTGEGGAANAASSSSAVGATGEGLAGVAAASAEEPIERKLEVQLSKLKLLDVKALLHNTRQQHRGGLPVFLEVAKLTSTTISRTPTPVEMGAATSVEPSADETGGGAEATVAAVVEDVVAAAVASALDGGGSADAGNEDTDQVGAEEEASAGDTPVVGGGEAGGDTGEEEEEIGEAGAFESASADEDSGDQGGVGQGDGDEIADEDEEVEDEEEEDDAGVGLEEGEEEEGDQLAQNDDVDTQEGQDELGAKPEPSSKGPGGLKGSVTFTISGPSPKVLVAVAAVEKIVGGKKAQYVLQHLRQASRKSTGGRQAKLLSGGRAGRGGGGGGRGGAKAQSGQPRRRKVP